MLSYLMEVTFCWAGFYALYALLLSGTTFFNVNRWYLFGTLLLGVLVPLVPLPVWYSEPSSMVHYFEPIQIGVQQVELKVHSLPARDGLSISGVLLTIYLLGVGVLGARLAIGLWKLWALYRNSIKEKRDGFTMVITEGRHLPFSFFNLLFWSRELDLEEEEWTSIMRHEKAHIRGLHSLDVLLTELLCAVFWCVPPVYLFRRSLRQVHEYLADRAALQVTRPKRYGHMLLRQSQFDLQLAFANHLLQSPLKKRIKMMTRHQSARSALLRYALILPLLTLFLLVFANRSLIGQTLLEIHKPDGTIEKHTVDPKNIPDDLVSPELIKTVDVKKNPDLIVITLKDLDAEPKVEPQPEPSASPAPKVRIRASPEPNQNINTTAPEPGIKVRSTSEGIDTDPTIIVYRADGTITKGRKSDGIIENISPDEIESINVNKTDYEENDRITIYMKGAAEHFDGASSDRKLKDVEVEGYAENPDGVTSALKMEDVEVMPRFPGCEEGDLSPKGLQDCSMNKLISYMQSELKYPEDAQKEGIEGIVVVGFKVDKDGKISSPEIIKSLNPDFDAEALRVVQAMPDWVPARHEGKAVAASMKLPFNFALPAKAPATAPSSAPAEGAYKLALPDFSASPNPSTGVLRVRFTAEATPTTLRISDLQGRVLLSRDMSDFNGRYDQQLDLDRFNTGTLFLSVVQGEKMFTRKIVLQE